MLMKNLGIAILIGLVLGLSSATIHAEAVSARILSVSGEATAFIPGRGDVTLSSNDIVPAGTEISTTGGGTVLIGLTPGAGSLIEENSTVAINKLEVEKEGEKVSKRDIELDLKNDSGAVISFLDQLDGVSDFKVQTPTGVAAARGTVWRTTSNAIQVLKGEVVMTIGDVTVSVPAGNAGNMEDGGVTGLTTEQIQELIDKLKDNGIDVEFNEETGEITRPDINNEGGENSRQIPISLEEVNSQEQ